MSFSVGIAGASGYVGGELLRLLDMHPDLELIWAGASSSAGHLITGQSRGLIDSRSIRFDSISTLPSEILDVMFLALPPREASAFVSRNRDKFRRVIDLGADFRHRSSETYVQWYGFDHPEPDELWSWSYGLTEWNRQAIAESTKVANPGCYATAALLTLLPIIKAGMIGEGVIYIDGKSGLSGAGRSVKPEHSLAEAFGDVTAYSVGGHRHLPEIVDQLSLLGGGGGLDAEHRIAFVPHLVPVARGLSTTCLIPLIEGSTKDDLDAAYAEAYANQAFVHFVEDPPHSKALTGSNCALVFADIDRATRHAVAICAIDNLMKGAAGQAIQNTNVMLGLPESTGLQTTGIWP